MFGVRESIVSNSKTFSSSIPSAPLVEYSNSPCNYFDDPVTLITGITFDRDNIEKWLFSYNNKFPVTKQDLSDFELTPNHTLRRLIQGWSSTLNASNAAQKILTPKPPVSKSHVMKIISELAKPHQDPIKCIKKLRLIASENTANKRSIEAAGTIEFMVSIINDIVNDSSFFSNEECYSNDVDGFDSIRIVDEALGLLHNIQISDIGLENLVNNKNGVDFVKILTKVMQHGSYESRAYAVLLLKPLVAIADRIRLTSLESGFFSELVQILHDEISHQAPKAALHILIDVCPWGQNKFKAAEAGAIPILIEALIDNNNKSSSDRRICEMAMVLLDLLCQCAEGRVELLNHEAGLAIVSKKILRVSHLTSERAMNILSLVARFCATQVVLNEMLTIGVVAKLCLVIQGDCGSKSKGKAVEMLKLHSRVWRTSSCLPYNLLASYPPS